MKHVISIFAFVVALTIGFPANGQDANPADGLVSTWMLLQVQGDRSGDEPSWERGARGVLILDRAGHVFEFFSTASRDEPESPLQDPLKTLDNFGGFWGRYEVDEAAGRITFDAWDGISPNVAGLEFSRDYQLDGDRLILTSGNEPHAQGDKQWVWYRMPTVEHLSPAYREVVGFWQHIDERRIIAATGEVDRISVRAPSVIVYTPAGFVGVHFPRVGREPLADTPTDDEAREAVRGYLGYFGTLNVYPGEVTHNILAGVSPGTGAILRRAAEIDGDELLVTLDNTRAQISGEPAEAYTTVSLKRLSGADDMLPRGQ